MDFEDHRGVGWCVQGSLGVPGPFPRSSEDSRRLPGTPRDLSKDASRGPWTSPVPSQGRPEDPRGCSGTSQGPPQGRVLGSLGISGASQGRSEDPRGLPGTPGTPPRTCPRVPGRPVPRHLKGLGPGPLRAHAQTLQEDVNHLDWAISGPGPWPFEGVLLLCKGLGPGSLSAHLGMSNGRIGVWMGNPEFL